MATIIGRKQETEELMNIYHRRQAQLVAVYGRRRVGKTFLVRELFKDKFTFYHTGVSPLELQDSNQLEAQLAAFNSSLIRYGAQTGARPKNWTEAFEQLITLINGENKDKRVVVLSTRCPGWTPRAPAL